MTRILEILIVVKKETVKIYTTALHKNLNGLHMGTLVSTYDFRHGQTIPVVKETTQCRLKICRNNVEESLNIANSQPKKNVSLFV